MALKLTTIPGFADLPNAVLDAEKFDLGAHQARISNNAAFGMVRLEIFTGTYKHDEEVGLPVSSVDGYNYSRSECMYFWAITNSGSPDTSFATYRAPWTMWYIVSNVDQLTGKVTSIVGYRGNGDHPDRQAQTNDGVLQVWTIAQRAQTTLILDASPTYTDVADADIATDKPLTEEVIHGLNVNAKFGVVGTEVIYMGEFGHGDTVPLPHSPADSYAYSRAECKMHASWRWTADGTTSPIVPSLAEGQLADFTYTINASTGAVALTIAYDLNGIITEHKGRIAVWAFCSRTIASAPTVSGTFAEIINETFENGATLRASTVAQLNTNIRQALTSPEFFGPTDYGNGDTIALPTSAIDGTYTYSRDELAYVWTWAPTGDMTDRMSTFIGHISNLGVVTVDLWRFNSGASTETLEHTAGKLRTIVIGFRGRQQQAVDIVPGIQPGGTPGAEDSNAVYVNGVFVGFLS